MLSTPSTQSSLLRPIWKSTFRRSTKWSRIATCWALVATSKWTSKCMPRTVWNWFSKWSPQMHQHSSWEVKQMRSDLTLPTRQFWIIRGPMSFWVCQEDQELTQLFTKQLNQNCAKQETHQFLFNMVASALKGDFLSVIRHLTTRLDSWVLARNPTLQMACSRFSPDKTREKARFHG